MRFVRNLIAAAALATIALNGNVAGAPAGNNNNALVAGDPTEIATTTTASYTHSGSLPHFPTGKDSIVVPGASTSASPSGPVHGGGSITLEPTPFPSSDPCPVPEGDDDKLILAGAGVDGGAHTVTVPDELRSGDSISVAGRDAVLDGRQMLPWPKPKLGPAGVEDAVVSVAPHPPGGNGGSHPDDKVEVRQMLPITSSAISARQMLPISSTVISERQMLPITSTIVSARQMLPISSSAVSARQMLPITSTIISERQMLPISSTIISERQMLPISSTVISERQMLPISSTVISERQMLPITSSGGSAREAHATPSTPFGRQPDPRLSAPAHTSRPSEAPCVGGCGVNDPPATTVDLPQPTATAGWQDPAGTPDAQGPAREAYTRPGTPFGQQPDPRPAISARQAAADSFELAQAGEGAVSTVTATSLHTVTLTPSSTSTSSTVLVGTVRPEPTTETLTRWVTSTVRKPTASDNCTVHTTLSSAPTTETYPTFSVPYPTGNGTLVITPASSPTLSSRSVTTTLSPPPAPSTETVTTITTDSMSCHQGTCAPTTVTTTSAIEGPTSTAAAVSGTSSSADTCTESGTSSSSTSAEETTRVTVTTHITTTLSGFTHTGKPRLTPPPITQRGQDPTFSTSAPEAPPAAATHTEDVGPPRLTPPPMTKRDAAGDGATHTTPTTLATSTVRPAA